MQARILWALTAVGVLAACGGGGGGVTTPSPAVTFSTLKSFSDGAGVGRGVATDGTEVVFIAPDISELVTAANQSSSSPLVDVQFSDFAVTETLSTAVVREGTISFGGEVAAVLIIEDNSGEAGVVYLDVPNYGTAVFATGSAYGAAPSGQFTYNGVNTITNRIDTGGAGDFALTANFTNGTFTYNGNFSYGASDSASLTGTGTIDTVNGRLDSSNLSANVAGSTSAATMYGQLHGTSAEAVSGVFHTNEANPNYAGAFVGSK